MRVASTSIIKLQDVAWRLICAHVDSMRLIIAKNMEIDDGPFSFYSHLALILSKHETIKFQISRQKVYLSRDQQKTKSKKKNNNSVQTSSPSPTHHLFRAQIFQKWRNLRLSNESSTNHSLFSTLAAVRCSTEQRAERKKINQWFAINTFTSSSSALFGKCSCSCISQVPMKFDLINE